MHFPVSLYVTNLLSRKSRILFAQLSYTPRRPSFQISITSEGCHEFISFSFLTSLFSILNFFSLLFTSKTFSFHFFLFRRAENSLHFFNYYDFLSMSCVQLRLADNKNPTSFLAKFRIYVRKLYHVLFIYFFF